MLQVAMSNHCNETFERRDILGHVQLMIPYWNRMPDGFLDHPVIAGNRKFRLMVALEVTVPGEPRFGSASDLKVGGSSKSNCEAGPEVGIVMRPCAGCFETAPPLIVTPSEIEELGRRLRSALDRVLAGLSPGTPAASGWTP